MATLKKGQQRTLAVASCFAIPCKPVSRRRPIAFVHHLSCRRKPSILRRRCVKTSAAAPPALPTSSDPPSTRDPATDAIGESFFFLLYFGAALSSARSHHRQLHGPTPLPFRQHRSTTPPLALFSIATAILCILPQEEKFKLKFLIEAASLLGSRALCSCSGKSCDGVDAVVLLQVQAPLLRVQLPLLQMQPPYYTCSPLYFWCSGFRSSPLTFRCSPLAFWCSSLSRTFPRSHSRSFDRTGRCTDTSVDSPTRFTDDPVRIVHDINRIVNNLWRGDSMNFRSTPDSTKELWWSEFKRAFTWDPTHEVEIRRIFKKKCGDHIRHILNHAKTRKKKPACITDENWVKISKFWETEESKKISNQNKLNQAYNTGASSATYAGGSINMDEHTRRLAKEIGRDPDFIDTFTRAFQKKDKSWSGDRAKAMKDKFTELSSVASSEGSESSVGNELSLWLEASGGCKGGGRILGMGSLSRTHRVAGTSSTTSPAVTSQIHSLTEEVTQLKGLLQQRDEEMIRRDKQMKQRDNQIKKLQKQQERILQHFQLQLGDDDDDDDDDDSDDGGDPS
ncbi:uncharacterized protein LOC141823833 [Curcuma longa]|uniref:uncharacterized protein LOC141823833 n=1 Tax=Curcuma longa TaxID=136217 RepID=UPI003D9EF09E